MSGVEGTEGADGVHRMALPLGIHGVATVSAYLLHGDDGDTLVDCGIAAGLDGGDPGPDGTVAVAAALTAAGSAPGRLGGSSSPTPTSTTSASRVRSCGVVAASSGCIAAPIWTWPSTTSP